MPVEGTGCLCPRCLKAEIARRVGDCLGCAHSKTLKTKGGSAIFLCGRAEFRGFAARGGRLMMASFYRWQRERLAP